MARVERIADGGAEGRELLIVQLDSLDDELPRLTLSGRYFAALVACDASTIATEEIASFAERLLDAGCVYVCCWEPDCERVHDIFDEVIVSRPASPGVIMTTWHNESLDEAVDFLLVDALPDAVFADQCLSSIAVVIGRPDWARVVVRQTKG